MLCPINAAIPHPLKWFRVLISFRFQNAQIEPKGQPKWHFWPISWDAKRYDLETMLYPLNVALMHYQGDYKALYLVWKPKYSHFKFWAMRPKIGQKSFF